MQNSSSDFSVYSTNGEQLAGTLSGFNELAHEFDKKRIVFYFEDSDTAIILGTRLIVQIIGGREERAIFIKRYSRSKFSMTKDFINSFYADAKARVEHLPHIQYRVLGLLKEGDLPIQESSITVSTISAIIGKILIGKPVKLKIEDLSFSFGALKQIIESFKQKNILNYKIAIAQYPVDADILISPNVSGMDLEILNNGLEKIQLIFEKKQRLFEAISEIYDQQRATIRPIDLQGRNALLNSLKKTFLDSSTLNDIIKTNPKDTQDILDLYQNDVESLYLILKKIFNYNQTLNGINNETIALIVNHIIEVVKNPGHEDKEILKIGYNTPGNDEMKNNIQNYLISQGIFEEYLLTDLFQSSIKEGNIQLLKSIVDNKKFNDQNLQILKNGITIHNVEQNQVLTFIEKMFESNFEKKSKGQQIYQTIIDHYQNQEFNTKKLNQLQERYNRPLIPAPQPPIFDKKTLVIILLLVIAIIGLIFSVLSFFGILTFMHAGNQPIVTPPISNQTIPETSVIPNETNNPVLAVTIINNSSFVVDGNQTDFQELYKFIAISNAPSVRFIYKARNETVSKSAINTIENLTNSIDRVINTT